MFSTTLNPQLSKAQQYGDLLSQARSLMSDETDRIANSANFAALVYHSLADLNWAGFYFFDGAELVVGPFQGKHARVRIALGSSTNRRTGRCKNPGNHRRLPRSVSHIKK